MPSQIPKAVHLGRLFLFSHQWIQTSNVGVVIRKGVKGLEFLRGCQFTRQMQGKVCLFHRSVVERRNLGFPPHTRTGLNY